jgi:hypothetical protein
MRYFLSLLFLLPVQVLAAELKPFESDGCTMFVDGPAGKPHLWSHCCFEHDLRYWFGGSKVQMKSTDLELKKCVKDVAGSFWANLIYDGVVTGHSSPIKSKYHWSWAWEPKRKDLELSQAEKVYVEDQLWKLNLDPQMTTDFIEKYLKP